MRINVTQKHIDDGLRRTRGGTKNENEAEFCPVALAIKEALRTSNVVVGFLYANINGEIVQLPDDVTTRIRHLYNPVGHRAIPFEFELAYAPT